jgi:hypothetical protein
MQRVIDYGVDVQGYVKRVRERGVWGLGVPEEALECPWCEEGHRLHRHGSYERYASWAEGAEQTQIGRLLCEVVGRTVSLLPACLAPRKQHSWAVVGRYFEGRVSGLSQRGAMEAATRVNPSRQKGAYWEHCLMEGRVRAEASLFRGRRQGSRGHEMASYVHRLRQGFPSLGEALAMQNRRLHERLGVWLL